MLGVLGRNGLKQRVLRVDEAELGELRLLLEQELRDVFRA